MNDRRVGTEQTGALQCAKLGSRFKIVGRALGNVHQQQIDLATGNLARNLSKDVFVKIAGRYAQYVFYPFVARTGTVESGCPIQIPRQSRNTGGYGRRLAPS